MIKKKNDKNIENVNKIVNREDNKECIKNRASPVKIAYYIQRMTEKQMNIKEILLILSSQFERKDLRKFAESYRYCFYIEDIRRIANLIYNIPRKNMDRAIDIFVHDFAIKKEILPREYLGHRQEGLKDKIKGEIKE